MLIKELDIALINPLCNHVKSPPSVLVFGAGLRADEEVVFEFALESVLLDVVG